MPGQGVLPGARRDEARPRPATTCAFAEPLMRTMGAGRCSCSASPRAPAGPPSSRSGSRTRRRSGWRRRSSARRTAPTSRALVAADLAHVAWAVNLGCLGFHVWPYLAADPEHTDELRLDLDPQPGTDFTHMREAAPELKALLDELGVVGYPKTTGNRGLHVYVRLEPRWDSYQVRSAAVAVARELERRRPDLITAQWWKEDRGERIFVDFNQNAPHKTVFGAWCVRARPGRPGVDAAPLGRDRRDPPRRADDRVAPGTRSRRGGDPWAGDERRPAVARAAPRRCTSATGRTASWTRRGRPSTRSSRTSRRASRAAGRRRPERR